MKAVAKRIPGARALADRLLYRSCVRLSTAGHAVEWTAAHSRSPFTFVQVGSNDGRTGDPVFATATRIPVRGVLIEPVPELFERLRSTYAGTPGLAFVNAAVGESDGTCEFYWVPPVAGDPVWVDQLGSFSREVIVRHGDEVPGIADRIRTVTVACRTLPSLVRENRMRRIDLLHIDAEGSDYSILKTVDFRARWAPRFILYEEKHLGAERASARDLLKRSGYQTVELGPDVFAFRRLRTRVLIALHVR